MQIFPQLFKKNRVGSLFESVALQSLTEVRVWLRNLDDPLFLSAPTDQIRTIDKRRLKNRIATLTSDEVTALQDVLRQMFCE